MAITLDELLGRSRADVPEDIAADRFPSYGEFTARRSTSDASYSDAPAYRYDYDAVRRPAAAPRTAEAARDYEASRPYRAPREEEYRPMDYSMPVREDRGRESFGGYAPERSRAEESARVSGLYEFTRNDAERASGDELYERLSSAGGAQTARYEQAARESYASEDYAARYRAEHKTRKKARFGLKAKLIIAAYVVVLAIVGVLIIVNAKPLNNGTAAVPSGAVVSVE